ncbi:MAG: hypothetical protein RIS92_789 [Verrucomicrobiota bacterium]|jgi:hypothetical protein
MILARSSGLKKNDCVIEDAGGADFELMALELGSMRVQSDSVVALDIGVLVGACVPIITVVRFFHAYTNIRPNRKRTEWDSS